MDARSKLWFTLLVFALTCEGFLGAGIRGSVNSIRGSLDSMRGSLDSMQIRGSLDSKLLSNILQRRKRAVTSDCVKKDFIKDLEGMETEAYVPKDKYGNVLGHSGVTVGGGVDLGSKSRSFFRRIGVCSALIDRLEPYFGRRGRSADTYLQQNPLTLTDSEASYLTDLVVQHNVQSVESRYNAAIGWGKLRFNQLTDAQKTVITSVLFQYGSPRRVPTFWRHVTNQDWDAAVAELRDFGDKYPTRRNKEADLLENDDGSKGNCDSGSASLLCPTRSMPPPVDSNLRGLGSVLCRPRCNRNLGIP